MRKEIDSTKECELFISQLESIKEMRSVVVNNGIDECVLNALDLMIDKAIFWYQIYKKDDKFFDRNHSYRQISGILSTLYSIFYVIKNDTRYDNPLTKRYIDSGDIDGAEDE